MRRRSNQSIIPRVLVAALLVTFVIWSWLNPIQPGGDTMEYDEPPIGWELQ